MSARSRRSHARIKHERGDRFGVPVFALVGQLRVGCRAAVYAQSYVCQVG